MKQILSFFTFICLANCFSYAQDADAYSQTLQKMFEVSGSENTYKAVITQSFNMFRQQYAGKVEEDFWDEFEAEFMQTSMDDLVTMLSPIYQKHLNEDDLETIIEFYETPAGQKFAEKTPLITQESMQAGQEWGKKIGETFIQKMEEKGY